MPESGAELAVAERPRPLPRRCRAGPQPRHPDGAPVRERLVRGGTARQGRASLHQARSFTDLVNQRWNEGVTNAEAITAELRTLGFKGSAQVVRRYLRPFRLPGTSRSHPDPDRRKPAPPSRPSRSSARSARRR